jgi:hypothetical protein
MKLAVPSLLLFCAVTVAATGCASSHAMNDSHPVPQACIDTCQQLAVAPTEYILTVNIAEQSVSLYKHGKFVRKMSASTSRFGIGQVMDSNCTPLGLHCIAEKIGDGAPPGTVFKERRVIGHNSQPEFARAKITTRIMWLQGLEPGLNQGGKVDTHARTIYIHGTSDQESIGAPASHGCVHLSDRDLISMFDLLPSGTLVWIAEK